MTKRWILAVGAGALLAILPAAAPAQKNDRQNQTFDEKDRQTTKDWYDKNKDHPPAGFRSQDRLSPDQESRLREGAPLDKDLRKKTHPVPDDLRRRLPDPPPDHRYVAVGGHVGLIDNNFQVKAVIRLH